jgi:putative DNA primase/helicase
MAEANRSFIDEHLIVGSGCDDTTNSERFAGNHAYQVRYWHERKRWLIWNALYWDDDSMDAIIELGKETARQIYVEASNEPSEEKRKALARHAERSMNRDKIKNMLSLAQSIPSIATTTKTWDSDPYLLNFLNGTVDLRTGELHPHQKDDYITKLVRCSYEKNVLGPNNWTRFVEQTFGNMALWVQKAVGYSLTGITSEKVSFLLWGITDTGKSTFLSTLQELFRDYSTLLQIETLMWNKSADNNASADLADLRGARFVITSETEEGQRLREAKLKRIVQGTGQIKTARKYENPIIFPETHKLWIDCNHQPAIRGTDDAIWNRILPIPCTHQVTDCDKDPRLKEKLLGEAEAIASWAVHGAVCWHQEKGLKPLPESIRETRNQWRTEMDMVGQFIDECCIRGGGGTVQSSNLYKTFTNWAQRQGHTSFMNATVFGNSMTERKFKKERKSSGVFYLGIDLNEFARTLL